MLSNLSYSIARFLRHRRGNYGMMAALLTVPLLIAVTVPIDTVRALGVRTVVQQASDAAALAAATSGLATAAERSSLADSVFQANLDSAKTDLNISSAKLVESSSSGGSSPDTYTYSVVATVGDGATILPIGTLFDANIDSVVKTGNQQIDIALVLDNSGSMGWDDNTSTTRMTELKNAATTFVDQFAGNSSIKIALVPFDSQVRVNLTAPAVDNVYDTIDCANIDDSTESGRLEKALCEANQTTTTTTRTITTQPDFEMDCSLLTNVSSYETQWCNAGKLGFGLPLEQQGRWVVSSDARTRAECVKWGGNWWSGYYCKRYSYSTYYVIDSRVYISTKENDRYRIYRYSGTCESESSYNSGDRTPCGAVHYYDAMIFDQPEPAPVTQTVTDTSTAYDNGPLNGKDITSDTYTPDADLIFVADGVTTYEGCYVDRAMPYDITGYVTPIDGQDTAYRPAQCAEDSLSYVTGLSDQHATIKNKINAMTPSGWTNITIGVAWGMEALSANAPLSGARAAGTSRKIIVLMTDGENTQNYWKNVNVWNGRQWVVDQPTRDWINARTSAACNTAKANGVEIYTVNLVDGDSSLLSGCADNPDQAVNAIRGGLEKAFKDIATQIKRTYLAS